MQYTYLGTTGLQISKLSFGAMTFGGEADAATSKLLYKRCREAGINFFDCANIYHKGASEEILGSLIKNERQEVIISSKVYFPTGPDVNARGLSRRHIMQSVEQSLTRLNTDYIDIYFMHRFDEHTPLEESLSAMTDLLRQGKILYVGISNFAAWQIMKTLGISQNKDFAPIICVQPMYNLIKRQAEVEIFPLALSEKVGIISYNPLGGGLLTGKYSNTNNTSKVQGRLRENKMYELRYGDASAQIIASKFVKFAQEHGYSPASLAIAWAASHPAVSSPLLGARNIEQLEDCLRSLEINMTTELRAAISALSPTPPPATDRTDEALIAHP